MINKRTQIRRLKRALEEIRDAQSHFSDESFAQILMVLLEKLRHAQTTLHGDHTPASDEIRLVTVLFLDVKDSTRLARRLDASDWKAVISNAHYLIEQEVQQWDGRIGQYLGDGVLCFFGAQNSRGDDAHHAVSCALAIQQTLDDYAARVIREYGVAFGVRIGISTGRVIVGMIGSASRQELLALGPATNLAARLQTIASPGDVLVDGNTYSRVRGDFVTEVQSPTQIKGFDDPINTYRIVARRTLPAAEFTDTEINGIELPLVGRADSLSLMNQLCAEAERTRQFRTITLMGDIGIGKSRLLQETVRLTEGHFRQIVLSARYEDRQQPYNLLRNLLRSQCHLDDDSLSAEAIQERIRVYVTDSFPHRDAASIAAALGGLTGYLERTPANARDAVMSWFRQMSLQEPLLIVVDNLQWADTISVELLQELTDTLHGRPAVLLAAARPGYRSRYPDYMHDQPQHTRIHLERLPLSAASHLIESVLKHVKRVPPTMTQHILDRAEGNPLFVREFLQMLFETGVFQQVSPGKWRFNIILYDVALNNVPSSLINVLQARLDELPPETRHTLQIAAVAGQRFWAGSVAAMSGKADAAAMLDELALKGLLICQPDSPFTDEKEYHFQHTLYRKVAYDMLPRVQREAYHLEMAYWLVERVADKPNFYPLLATQFLKGRQYDAALFTYVEAVEDHIQRNQLEDALALIDDGLAMARNVPRQDALPAVSKLWAWRGQALVVLQRYEEASAACQSSLMLLKELPPEQLISVRIMAERMLGMAYTSLGRYNKAYDALSRAHNLLPFKATLQIAGVLRAFGVLNLHQGRLDDSEAYLRRSFVRAEQTGLPRYIAASQSQLGIIHMERGRIGDALYDMQAVLHINEQENNTVYQALDHRYLGLLHMLVLDSEQALAHLKEASQLLKGTGRTDILLKAYRGLALTLAGRRVQGQALIDEAVEHGHNSLYSRQRLQLIQIGILCITGQNVKARELAMSFVQQIESQNPVLRARGLRWLGRANHALGDVDAISALREALDLEAAYAGRDVWICARTLADCLDDSDEARHYYALAADKLQERINSLSNYPDLQAHLQSHDHVQHIFRCAERT